MGSIKLIATDLDGTLIGRVNEFPLYADYRDKLSELRSEGNVVWAACTGRGLMSFRNFFRPMRIIGLAPDFIIVNHAYIYGWGPFGYMPHIFWNLHIRWRMWLDRLSMQNAIDEWYDMIKAVSIGVTTVRREKNRLCLRFSSEESAIAAAEMLDEKTKQYKQLRVFRFLREIDVRSVPFTKGLALSELAQHLGIGRADILAIGNGHNDISMLDGNVTGMMGCPSNSDPEVMDAVHKAGGHISTKRALAGVLDVIEVYRTDSVCSDLPEDWKPPSTCYNPHSRRSSKRKGDHRNNIAAVMGGIAIVYAVLLVFANFGLIPFVSGLLMKPYRGLERLLTMIVRLF
ncbi:MAG: HAD family phosphatase [Kiritimatiellae bacterium]|nr:HAD family phosphatase [Kiritimatiellia bacterium]